MIRARVGGSPLTGYVVDFHGPSGECFDTAGPFEEEYEATDAARRGADEVFTLDTPTRGPSRHYTGGDDLTSEGWA